MDVPSGTPGRRNSPDLGERLAVSVASQNSRRSFLYRLAAGTGALFGVTFASTFVMETGMHSRAEGAKPAGTCRHPDNCSATGLKCGMANVRDCARFQNTKFCKGCWNKKTGCPGDLVRGSRPWFTCCICPDDAHKGTNIEFHDCCGGFSDYPASCQTDLCETWVRGGGCEDAGRCGTIQSWCEDTPGLAICTLAVDTRDECPIS
jgi:hypothetical protein